MKRMNIDKRRRYYMVLDTETANGMKDPLVYDIGGVIVDKQGKVYESFSWAIMEVFSGEKEMMDTAYYAAKIPAYKQAIKEGRRKEISIWSAREYIKILLDKYSTVYPCTVVAHNARFDYTALNNTVRWLSGSKCRYFLPYGTPLWDTLTMARQILGKQPSYKSYCLDNGFITPTRKQPQFTAEVIHRYLTGDKGFLEVHEGLDDTMIEKGILAYCLRSHKSYRKTWWKVA